MKKNVLRVVAMLLASVLFISELNVTAFASEEFGVGGEITLETEEMPVGEEDSFVEDTSFEDDFSDDSVSDDSISDDAEEGEIDIPSEEISENEDIISDEESDEELIEIEGETSEEDEVLEEADEEDYDESLAAFNPYQYPYLVFDSTYTVVMSLADSYKSKSLSVEIPYGIKKIAPNAFANCQVYSVSFPNSLEEIGDSAFEKCPLTSLNFPNSLKKIGKKAFYYCFERAGAGSSDIGPQEVTIPSNVTYIGQGAFYGCVTIKDVTINSNIINLTEQGTGVNARFGQCEIQHVYFGKNVTEVPAYLFQGAKFAQDTGGEIIFPKTIKKIGEYAFYNAQKLRTVKFEEGSQLYYIKDYAFYKTFSEDATYDVDLSNTRLDTVGHYAFYGSTYLPKGSNCFSFPEGTRQFGDYAFNGVRFGDLYLPGSIIYIGKKGFTTPTSSPYTCIMTPAGSYAYEWFFENCSYFKKTFTYPLTYVLNGGTFENDYRPYYYHTEDNHFTLPKPKRKRFSFEGWYLDAKLTKKIEYITNDYSKPLTLYAKWKGEECTVLLCQCDADMWPDSYTPPAPYDSDTPYGSTYASELDSETLTINYYDAIPALPTPTRDGYTFKSWVIMNDDGEWVPFTKGSKYIYENKVEIFSTWTPITYTLRLHSNLEPRDTVKPITLTFDKVEKIENPFVSINHGQTIDYWSTANFEKRYETYPDSSSDNGGKPWNLVTTKGKSTDLYAQWIESIYDITFDYQGGNRGSYPESTTTKYKQAYGVNKDGNNINWPEMPTKNNCNFIGWFDEYGNRITKDTECVIEKPHTLTAYWQTIPTLNAVKCYVKEPGDADYTELKDTSKYNGTKGTAPDGTRIRFVGESGSTLYWANSGNPTTASNLYENEFVVNGDFAAGKTINVRAYRDGAYSSTFSITVKRETISNEKLLNDLYNNKEDFSAIGGNPDSPDMSKVTNVQDENGFWIVVGTEYKKDANNKYKWNAKLWEEGPEAGISVQETGAAYKFPYVHVYFGNTLLKEKTDYTIAYKNNTKPADDDEVNEKGASIAPTMTVSLKGNYSGKLERVFSIEEAVETIDDEEYELININKFKVNMPKINLEYTGSRIEWGKHEDDHIEVLPKAKEPALVEGTDYECEYYNNVNVGTATLVIKGIGDYYGRIEKTFKITPYDIGKDSSLLKEGISQRILPEGLSVGDDYDAVNKRFIMRDTNPSSEVEYTASKLGTTTTLSMLDSGVRLTEGVDYTLKFSNNKAVGSKTAKNAPSITIVGKGNYKGTYSAKVTYDIIPGEFNKPLVADVVNDENKPGLKPVIVVTAGEGGMNKLKEKTDYTVELFYAQNGVQVNNSGNPKVRNSGAKFDPKDKVLGLNFTGGKTVKMKAKITGIKNFDGFVEDDLTYYFVSGVSGFECYTEGNTTTFSVDATATNVAYVEKAGILKPTVKIAQIDSKNGYTNVLKAGTDYDKKFTYKYAEDTLISRKDKKVTFYKVRTKGTEVDMKQDIIPAGTKIEAVVTGIKKYEGVTHSVYFYVLNSLKSAKVTVGAKYFTGNPIYLSKADMVVTIGGGAKMITLTPSDYEIVSYKNNIKKGTAKVTIRGIGNYMDSKEGSFVIKAVGQK